jgi:hypothetical protein
MSGRCLSSIYAQPPSLDAVLGGLLQTAYSGKAALSRASVRQAAQVHSPVVISAQRVELVSSKISAGNNKAAGIISAKNEVLPADDKGGLAKAAAEDKNIGEEQNEKSITGTVTSILSDTWTIGGVAVRIDTSTEIDDNPQVGDNVEVRANRQPDGSLIATRIRQKN